MDRRQFQTRARFRHAIRRHRIRDGATLLVAVSGGRDSMVLLDLVRHEAKRRSWQLWIVHVDHGLRANSSDDASWVRSQAQRLGLPSLGFRARTGLWDRRSQSEEAARHLRYAAFRRAIQKTDADFVFLGHHLQDQAETVLLRLFRGAGVRGLAAMSGRRGCYVRPLLSVDSREIAHWSRMEGLEYREDPSNSDLSFTRNRLRREIWPLLESLHGPSLARTLARSSDAFRVTLEHLENEVDRTWEALAPQIDTGLIRLDRVRLATYDRAVVESVIRRASKMLLGTTRNLGRAPVAAVAAAVREAHPKKFHFPSGLRVFVNAKVVRLVDSGVEMLSNGSPPASDSLRGPYVQEDHGHDDRAE